MRLHVGHQHSQFWPILAWFVDYYSLFWRPGVISTIDEPRGVFKCRSSTRAVLVDSDPFRGLLLNVLWSQSDFHGCRTPRYAYVLVVKTRSLVDSGPFLGLLLSFGIPDGFPRLTNPGCVFVSVINTCGFCQFWPISWTITHCFGVPTISIVVEP